MDIRTLHLQGAIGKVRTELWQGREHLVVPVVALQEAVIHAVNAENAELVLASALTDSVTRWAGHPLVVGHPVKDGKQCSANSTEVLEQHGFGFIRHAKMAGNRLGIEAMVDVARLEALNQQQLLKDLRAGVPVEVSVGAFVTTNDKRGEHGGRRYNGEWVEIKPDHLAFLPGGKGACSIEMGCGAHRAASTYLVTAEGFVPEGEIVEKKTFKDRILALFVPGTDAEADEAMRTAIGKVISSKNMTTIQSAHDAMAALGAVCGPTAAAQKDCPTCDGTGQVTKDKQQQDCESCGGTGYLKAASAITPDLKAAECGCKEKTMDKKARIAALIANAHNPMKDLTEATSDDVLTVLEAQAVTNEKHATELKAAQDKAAADLKAATDKAAADLKAAQASQIPAEELAELRSLAAAKKAEDEAQKQTLVTTLKAAQKVYTEADLNAMDLKSLEKLMQVANIAAPADYSGKALPVVRAASGGDFTPPNPYPALAKKAN